MRGVNIIVGCLFLAWFFTSRRPWVLIFFHAAGDPRSIDRELPWAQAPTALPREGHRERQHGTIGAVATLRVVCSRASLGRPPRAVFPGEPRACGLHALPPARGRALLFVFLLLILIIFFFLFGSLLFFSSVFLFVFFFCSFSFLFIFLLAFARHAHTSATCVTCQTLATDAIC